MTEKQTSTKEHAGTMLRGKMLRLPEAAERLGVAPWTCRRWISQGLLTSCLVGGRSVSFTSGPHAGKTVHIGGTRLVPEAAIEEFLARHVEPARVA